MCQAERLIKYPRTLIAYACNLAAFDVWLDDSLPIYVRSDNYIFTGHYSLGEYSVVVTAPTLAELYKQMINWHEFLTRKDNIPYEDAEAKAAWED